MRLSNSFGFALFLLLLREKHRVFLLICLFLLITKVFLKFKRILFGKNIRLCAFKCPEGSMGPFNGFSLFHYNHVTLLTHCLAPMGGKTPWPLLVKFHMRMCKRYQETSTSHNKQNKIRKLPYFHKKLTLSLIHCLSLMHASKGILNLPTSSLHLCLPFQQNH